MSLNETLRKYQYPFTASYSRLAGGTAHGVVLDNQGRLVTVFGTLEEAMTEAHALNQAVLARRPEPVAAEDHAFEGDGYDNPSICSCGRYREEHLRH